MKVACDICDTVSDSRYIDDWLKIKAGDTAYCLCRECQNKFWNLFNEKDFDLVHVVYCHQCEFKNEDGTCRKFSTDEKEFHTMMHDFCVWGKEKQPEGSKK